MLLSFIAVSTCASENILISHHQVVEQSPKLLDAVSGVHHNKVTLSTEDHKSFVVDKDKII